MNNLVFLQVISPASTYVQMTSLRQKPPKKKPDPKQKLLRKDSEKDLR